eukprot:4582201-Pleurochrysis_carterae.AAC.1
MRQESTESPATYRRSSGYVTRTPIQRGIPGQGAVSARRCAAKATIRKSHTPKDMCPTHAQDGDQGTRMSLDSCQRKCLQTKPRRTSEIDLFLCHLICFRLCPAYSKRKFNGGRGVAEQERRFAALTVTCSFKV